MERIKQEANAVYILSYLTVYLPNWVVLKIPLFKFNATNVTGSNNRIHCIQQAVFINYIFELYSTIFLNENQFPP